MREIANKIKKITIMRQICIDLYTIDYMIFYKFNKENII